MERSYVLKWKPDDNSRAVARSAAQSGGWFEHRQRLEVSLPKLAVFRPATIDLILTKMALAADDDLQDIQFLLRQETLTHDHLETAFGRARLPEVEEIRELFNRARPKVLALTGL